MDLKLFQGLFSTNLFNIYSNFCHHKFLLKYRLFKYAKRLHFIESDIKKKNLRPDSLLCEHINKNCTYSLIYAHQALGLSQEELNKLTYLIGIVPNTLNMLQPVPLRHEVYNTHN